MTDPKPMDPARLAALDHEASLMRVSMIPDSVLVVGQLIRELIEAHGYYRNRCPVDDDDLARVTVKQLNRWMRAQYRAQPRGDRFCSYYAEPGAGLDEDGYVTEFATDRHRSYHPSRLVDVAENLGRNAHDILDEIVSPRTVDPCEDAPPSRA